MSNTIHRRFSILLSPVFLVSLAFLILNDLYWKLTFSNWFTGKLSDLAGIIAFSLFFQVIFFSHRKLVCFLIAFVFIFWKSIYSDFFISFINTFSFFHLHRVVDYSDLIALLVIPFTSIYIDRFSYKKSYFHPVSIYIVSFISIISFVATSQKRHDYYIIREEYTLPFSKEIFIQKLNALKDSCSNPAFSFRFNSPNKQALVRYNDTEWVYISGYHNYSDTIYKWDSINHKRSVIIDTIYRKNIPIIDSFYIPSSNDFLYRFTLRNDKGQKECECAMADLRFIEQKNVTKIRVIGIGACTHILQYRPDQMYNKGYMLYLFEKEVLDKIF